ncbi:hypothetical protein C8F01DRAFT_1141121 [Mycena amicta]|nr:hypothetical protein C8F01DRAFT_1141121 [Mycena amicta]
MRSRLQRNSLDLPVELERIVFEMAARADVGTALRLALVARRVQDWVEPIIYERVVVSRPPEELKLVGVHRPMFYRRDTKAAKAPPILPFIRTISHRPPAFFAGHVRILHVANLTAFELVTVLTSCTGVAEFGWQNCALEPAIVHLLNMFRLTRLSVDHSYNFQFPQLAIQTTLTHLDLMSPIRPPMLEQFSALTHLSFAYDVMFPVGWREEVFKALPKLKILLHISASAYWSQMAAVQRRYPDYRLVVMLPPSRDSEVSAVHDLWPLAEEIVRERKEIAAAEKRKAEAEAAAATLEG